MLLSVIIPVFNEENTLGKIVSRVAAVAYDKEIIIVDDCSTDGTPAVIRDLQEKFGSIIKVLRQERNQGKGAAIQRGLAAVTGEITIIQDADLEYHPEDYPVALRLIDQGWADAVFGSRFLGPHRVFLGTHYFANKILNILVNVTTDSILTDMETGFKMMRSDVLKSLNVQSFKFDFEVEVTFKLMRGNYRLYEIPITYTGRGYAEGKKIKWQDGVHALFAIFKWAILARKSGQRHI